MQRRNEPAQLVRPDADPRPGADGAGAPGPPARGEEILNQHRAQADLLKRMNEALRASTGSTRRRLRPVAAPASHWNQNVPSKPLILGPQSHADEGDGDLWSLVQPASSPTVAETGVASFEEALKRADSSLEALVGRAPQSLAPGEEAPHRGLTSRRSLNLKPGMTTLRAETTNWAILSDPAEASRLRRQRLLRRAMENMGAMPNRIQTSENVAAVPAPAAPPPLPVRLRTPLLRSISEGQLAAQIDQRIDPAADQERALRDPRPPGRRRQGRGEVLLPHPREGLPPRPAPRLAARLREKMTVVFESIREAYETLYDDAARLVHEPAGQQCRLRAHAEGRAPRPTRRRTWCRGRGVLQEARLPPGRRALRQGLRVRQEGQLARRPGLGHLHGPARKGDDQKPRK